MDKKAILKRLEAVGGQPIERVAKSWGKDIPALIGAMIALVVGINLLPGIIDATKEAKDEVPAGMEALLDILPIVFMAILVLGAFSWFVSRKEKDEEVGELSGADEIRQLQKVRRRHLIYREVEG